MLPGHRVRHGTSSFFLPSPSGIYIGCVCSHPLIAATCVATASAPRSISSLLLLQVPAVGLSASDAVTSYVVIATSEGDSSGATFTGERVRRTEEPFDTAPATTARTLKLRPSIQYQTIRGFGNAFTDSAGQFAAEVLGAGVLVGWYRSMYVCARARVCVCVYACLHACLHCCIVERGLIV